MKPLLFDRWVFRGYETLDDFVQNKNWLYESSGFPYNKKNPRNTKKHKDKFIWVLSKYFFEGGKNGFPFWEELENSPNYSDCIFIYEDHEESSNLDYRWLEVMRRRRKGIYIKDACPKHFLNFSSPNLFNDNIPIIIPGYFPVYDKWNGNPFSIYQFNDKNSIYKQVDFEKRDIDVLFIGKSTTRRDKYIKQIQSDAKELNINAVISSKMVSFEEHINLMRRSKICYQFMAIGYRSSREWESMLNGSLLISDDRTVDFINTVGMEPVKDFIRYDPNNSKKQMKYWLDNSKERIQTAKSGHKSAWEVWSGCHDAYMPSRKLAANKIIEAGWS